MWIHLMQAWHTQRWPPFTTDLWFSSGHPKRNINTHAPFYSFSRRPLESQGNNYHPQYADDLIIFFVEGQKDLHIIKLIIYPFEESIGLHINFFKSYLYTTNYDFLPNATSAATLNSSRDCLPLTYLGVSLSGRRPQW